MRGEAICQYKSMYSLKIFFLLLLLPGSLLVVAQDPVKPGGDTISVETNLVVVNVAVRDQRQRHVGDLRVGEFRILEDAVNQRILSFEHEEGGFAVAILLDASGSMDRKLSLVRSACSSFIEGIRDGDSFSIHSFGDGKVRLLQNFTDIRDLPDGLWDLQARGKTPLYDAIVEAASQLSRRPERRRAILIVSDGADTESRASLDQAVRRAVEAQLALYAVEISDQSVFGTAGQESGAGILKSLAEKTGGRFFRTPGGARLREAFAETVDELRHQYTLTYASTNEEHNGKWRGIEVQIDRPDLRLRTRQGYWAAGRKK